MKYLLGIFFGNIAFIVVANVLMQPSSENVSVFSVAMIGILLLAMIGALWMYQSRLKRSKFNEELSNYQTI